MRVDGSHLASAGYLCIERGSGVLQNVPMATVFFVVDTTEDTPVTLWAVTGKHCIEEARATQRNVSVRVNGPHGLVDVPTNPDDWHESTEADVACCLWMPGDDASPPESAIPLEQLADENYRYRFGKLSPFELHNMSDDDAYVGAEIVFVGLFSQHAGTERNLPVARFGNISRLPSEAIVVKRKDGARERIVGYLVEARSWGGHSGSPAFWTHPVTRVEQMPLSGARNRAERRSGPRPTIPVSSQDYLFALLGLVSAHFDIPQRADANDEDAGEIVTRLNSGMAVVTPAHFIRRLIESEPVKEQVTEVVEAHIADFEPTATMDYIRNDEDAETEYERFEDLTRNLVHTPKPEKSKD